VYGRGMLDETAFAEAAARLCSSDPDLAAIVEQHGLPAFWAREPGLPTLVLLILEQQVSLASARAAYDRLETRLGGLTTTGILVSTDADLSAVIECTDMPPSACRTLLRGQASATWARNAATGCVAIAAPVAAVT